jgi:hypothetical protein
MAKEYCVLCKKETEHTGKLAANGNGDKKCSECGNQKQYIQGFNANLM